MPEFVKIWVRIMTQPVVNVVASMVFLRFVRSENSQLEEHSRSLRWLVLGGRRRLVRERAKRQFRYLTLIGLVTFGITRLIDDYAERRVDCQMRSLRNEFGQSGVSALDLIGRR